MINRQVTRLALALALTVLAAPAFAGDVGGALKYVPADFTTVVAVDLDAVRTSPLFATVLGMLNQSKDAKTMEQQIGFDPAKDLATFVFAGPAALMHHEEQFIAVFQGNFDGKRLIDFVKGQGDKVVEKQVGSAVMYLVDKNAAFAVDGKYVVAGAAGLVEQALAAKSAKNVTSGPLAALIKRYAATKGGFAVMLADKKVQDTLSGDVPEFAKLTSAGFALDVSAGAAITVAGNFATADAAAAVATAVAGAIKDAGSDPDMKDLGLGSLVSKVVAKATGKVVEITVKLDVKETKQLVDSLQKMRR